MPSRDSPRRCSTTEDGYNNGNGISHYIECREGYDRVVDIEQMGAKARDVDGELEGAEFRHVAKPDEIDRVSTAGYAVGSELLQ